MNKQQTNPDQKKFIYRSEERQKRTQKKHHIIGRVALCLGTLLLSLLVFAFGVVTILCKGPSPAARDLFVVSVMETSAAKFLARIYFSPEEIQAIINNNAVVETDEVTDETLVEIPDEDSQELDKDAIEIVEVKGDTFKGKMMIVNDPSRVYVSSPDKLGPDVPGMRVEEMITRDGAIGGVNAGGFMDIGGVGTGGEPLGILIRDGKLLYGPLGGSSTVIGFDYDNRLIVGNMSGKEAMERNLRDAVSFGPVLVMNGEPAQVNGTGGGLNPRTAIGQRKDGAVLILVIDGRQAHSMGATYNDLVDVMMEFGAINAANLDGGSSSLMFYKGELITTCASLYGPRRLPSAILVR